MVEKIDTFVSIIVPAHGRVPYFAERMRELNLVLTGNFTNHEIVVVTSLSDCPREDIALLRKECPHFNFYYLNGSYSEEIFWIVGLENCIGDYAVMFDFSTDPADIIPRCVSMAKNQGVIVYGIKTSGLSLRAFLNGIFYRLFNSISPWQVPSRISRFRVMSREVMNFILRNEDRHRLFRVLTAMSGSRYVLESYVPLAPRSALRSNHLGGDLTAAWYMLLASSIFPLRLVTVTALAASFLSASYGLYVVYTLAMKSGLTPGWASTSLQNAGMFFLLFILLAILSEYIFQILQDKRKTPLYFIAAEESSSAYLKKDEINVLLQETTRSSDEP